MHVRLIKIQIKDKGKSLQKC